MHHTQENPDVATTKVDNLHPIGALALVEPLKHGDFDGDTVAVKDGLGNIIAFFLPDENHDGTSATRRAARCAACTNLLEGVPLEDILAGRVTVTVASAPAQSDDCGKYDSCGGSR